MASKSKKKSTGKRAKIEVKHEFSTDEYKTRTDELVRSMQRVEEKDAAVKASAAVAKSEIKQLKASVNEMANQLQNGYEMRTVDVTVEFNRKTGVKKFYHFAPGKSENGSFIRQEAMTESDYQELPLEEGDKTAEVGDKTAEVRPPKPEGPIVMDDQPTEEASLQEEDPAF